MEWYKEQLGKHQSIISQSDKDKTDLLRIKKKRTFESKRRKILEPRITLED